MLHSLMIIDPFSWNLFIDQFIFRNQSPYTALMVGDRPDYCRYYDSQKLYCGFEI